MEEIIWPVVVLDGHRVLGVRGLEVDAGEERVAIGVPECGDDFGGA
ncbi:hypothetical protein HUT19_32805 [Streptomyces sp. NA02950]|nr:hypothetical protein [Streptomyces sp. NA02950]QKV95934.1 hypothetical protein HUT19_32805 [Streptomyces sp. NA02950]